MFRRAASFKTFPVRAPLPGRAGYSFLREASGIMNARKGTTAAALALLLAVSGCGDSRLVKVAGKLTYHGEPVPSTLVTFWPDDDSRPGKGLTDNEGNFTLRYSRTHSGAT